MVKQQKPKNENENENGKTKVDEYLSGHDGRQRSQTRRKTEGTESCRAKREDWVLLLIEAMIGGESFSLCSGGG